VAQKDVEIEKLTEISLDSAFHQRDLEQSSEKAIPEPVDLTEIIGPLNKEIFQLQTQVAELGDTVASHEKETQRIAIENSRLSRLVEDHKGHCAELESQLHQKEAELGFLMTSANESTRYLKQEITKVYGELNARREQDGVVHQTEQERNIMLKDICALELHLFQHEQRYESLSKDHASLIRRVANLEEDKMTEKEPWMIGVRSLEYEE
jgi:chromosome segregation ATPase